MSAGEARFFSLKGGRGVIKRDDIIKALEQLTQSEINRLYRGTWVLHEQHRPRIETGKMREEWKGREPDIIYSSFADPKCAVFVERRLSSDELRIQITPEQEARIRSEMASAFDRMIWGRFLPSQPEPVLITWKRRDGETVHAWGIRLFGANLLDDPAVRWEYQKAVWLWPVELLRAIWSWWQSLDIAR